MNNEVLLGTTLVSLFADILTILGIGGILTWGFVRKDSSRLADQIVEVFFFSIRIGLLFPVTLVFWGIYYFLFQIFRVVLEGIFRVYPAEFHEFWDPAYPLVFLFSYLLAVVFVGPFYLLACACILLWSGEPMKRLLNKLLKRDQ